MTARVEVYATQSCPYCQRARALLSRKGVDYELIDVGQHPEKRAEMTQRASGRRTVPQIFIDGVGIGGSDDIHALDQQGRLDAMLGL
ncbi:glutaredoxin 3 [Paracoccus contaminans]|uniref:Glutaredoxin n=1 Tax=Paracoccus contaminans TaxID=1945662 RepID=A0A1W6CWX8_9RHOB|nr:glutaredoxin 3 [Paracoccus contaminans]ARJ69356.1 glutaredoxin 3 [Paracoccus contaminans]